MPEYSDRRSVALIVGSASQPSLNRRLGDALTALAPHAGLELSEVRIDHLPFFGSHMASESTYPEIGRELKTAVDDADGLLLISPEYNRSVTGVLKNAIDWLSRPKGKSSFPDKPTAVIGMTKGVVSTAVAQSHLTSILTSQGAAVLGQPEAYIRYKEGLIDGHGNVSDSDTEEFLQEFLDSFRTLIDRYV